MTVHVEIPVPEHIDECVDQYLKLRNAIKAADDKHKEKMRRFKEHLEKLNTALLQKLEEIGGQSVRTPSGTVYRKINRSATISDPKIFRKFVIQNQLFDIVDWKANANAVDDFIQNNDAPPPGVNYTTSFDVGVRSK